jgi:CheY-like chemotaxis protein
VTPKRILVVDDDETHLTLAKELLRFEGYDVLIHRTAFGATERVLKERPDLLLLDVNMPGLSGEGLVGVLRQRDETRRTSVLLYSSNDEDALRTAAARLGVAGFVCKGDVRELYRKVEAVLG